MPDMPVNRQGTRATVGRVGAVCAIAVACLSASAWVMWEQDLKYDLPTPRPPGLVQPALNAGIDLPEDLATLVRTSDGPVLLDFFNPACPCSRFNRDHVDALQLEFGQRVRFVSVVETTPDRPISGDMRRPVVPDPDQRLARAMGVYSTPQAVLLDRDGRLLYRGNYNVTRYCVDPATAFARQAIRRHLGLDPLTPPDPPAAATVAYGCELPGGRP